jgi:hypothetical protein
VKELTSQRICDSLRYEPESGKLYWKVAKGGVKVGQEAGSVNKAGYIVVGLGGRFFYAHRLAFILMGEGSPDSVDHINRDRSDNRWSNLRSVSHQENVWNAHDSAGCYLLPSGRWQAKIKAEGITYFLGAFDTKEEAREAYLRAKERHHPVPEKEVEYG